MTQGIEDGRVNIDSVFATISESSWALKKNLHKTHIPPGEEEKSFEVTFVFGYVPSLQGKPFLSFMSMYWIFCKENPWHHQP